METILCLSAKEAFSRQHGSLQHSPMEYQWQSSLTMHSFVTTLSNICKVYEPDTSVEQSVGCIPDTNVQLLVQERLCIEHLA